MIFFSKPSTNVRGTEVLTEICISTVATYYLGSCGCYPCPHDVCCHLCCHGDGSHSGHSGGGSSLPGCAAADDAQNLDHLCSAGSCCSCSGRDDALSLLHLIYHLQAFASAEDWGSHRSAAQAAACGAAPSCCSSTDITEITKYNIQVSF